MKRQSFSHPVVSAVIPAYNGEKYIEETIISLLQQTQSLREIIVVDDNSSDQTCDIVKQLTTVSSEVLRLFSQKKNQGVSIARNFGIKKAKSDWVLFMDADDIAEPDLLKMELEHLRELEALWQTELVLAYPAYSMISATGEPLPGIHWSRQVEPEEILGYEFVRNQIITTSGTLVNKKAFQQVGGFDDSIRYSEDWDLWLKMANKGGFAYVDQPLIRVRRHSANISRNINNMLEGEQRVLRKYSFEFIQAAIDKRKLPWEDNRADLASMMFRMKRWEEGFEIAKSIVANKPNYARGWFLTGLFYLSQQEWIKAKEAFEKTLELAPHHGAAINNLGAIIAISGKAHEARELLSKALLLHPGYLDATHNLGLISNQSQLQYDNLRFTWRELRPTLSVYSQ